MSIYRVVVSSVALSQIQVYRQALINGTKKAGDKLEKKLAGVQIETISLEQFIALLMATKQPQIFAESMVSGNGTDWNTDELSILGNLNITMPVQIYDNGIHRGPGIKIHEKPFNGWLLFTPGALLRNEKTNIRPDYDEVVVDGKVDDGRYYQLYERRLLPLLFEANRIAGECGKKAFITVPGIGCGQFAGEFVGTLGGYFEDTLRSLLLTFGKMLSNIAAVYYDPFNEGRENAANINGIDLLVRPFTIDAKKKSYGLEAAPGHKPQLCPPESYDNKYSNCLLFSMVAWDHVSWPGNDFYAYNSRVTDDGVKAAATNTMQVMTGIEGCYDTSAKKYLPPEAYADWNAVIADNHLQLDVMGAIYVYDKDGSCNYLVGDELVKSETVVQVCTEERSSPLESSVYSTQDMDAAAFSRLKESAMAVVSESAPLTSSDQVKLFKVLYMQLRGEEVGFGFFRSNFVKKLDGKSDEEDLRMIKDHAREAPHSRTAAAWKIIQEAPGYVDVEPEKSETVSTAPGAVPSL